MDRIDNELSSLDVLMKRSSVKDGAKESSVMNQSKSKWDHSNIKGKLNESVDFIALYDDKFKKLLKKEYYFNKCC